MVHTFAASCTITNITTCFCIYSMKDGADGRRSVGYQQVVATQLRARRTGRGGEMEPQEAESQRPLRQSHGATIRGTTAGGTTP